MYIAVINYNMGNISSVKNAFRRIGADVRVTSNARVISNAKALVLPGVGAYKDAYKNLIKLNLIKVLKENVRKKVFLGICLGMQLLFEYSLENGKNKGLGILKGYVEKIPQVVKVPHIGWNQLKILKRNSKMFFGIKEGDNFYFDHSYYVIPGNKYVVSSITDYGIEIAASIEHDNIYGVQFHPEKSSAGGLRLLENFWNIVKEKG
ncbi:MAG: imidazole glycerol phosphate synthase subunit HisH [Chloroflexi bacterium]|nr:imidazole glycerol phosphate synthase subunit HisH [Chloroflexota bacterium]MBE3114263.1 imidazole glycerol phosphate synthase subunit HisH [Actinomycetota bacterium]